MDILRMTIEEAFDRDSKSKYEEVEECQRVAGFVRWVERG
jgi:hypothetical protein